MCDTPLDRLRELCLALPEVTERLSHGEPTWLIGGKKTFATFADHHIAYHALAGGKQSQGKTAGEALDALTAQFPEDEVSTLVVVQNLRPDRFFTARQQRRLGELMDLWRAARDAGASLPAAEQAELEGLVEQEARASGERTAALLREIEQ